MKILVVGIVPYDSGKTTIARELAKRLSSRGYNVGVAKPVAGHSLWYQNDTLRYTLEGGVLVGHDVIELRKSIDSSDPLEKINPFDIATMPHDIIRDGRIDHMSIERLIHSTTIDSAVIVRISSCNDTSKDVSSQHYLIKENYMSLANVVRELIDLLVDRLNPKPRMIPTKDLVRLLYEGVMATDKCLSELIKEHEILIIESFNDSGAPNMKSLDSDLVVAVSPGRVLLYRGVEYRKAFKIYYSSPFYSSSLYEKWPTTREIIRYLKPIETLEIPHKEFKERFEMALETLTHSILERSEELHAIG
ncbi:MAG: hypothetical protein ABWJ42_00710 [Sulfolobales archaeon]